MDIVTSDGRLTPPFHPLTVVNCAAWAGTEMSKPKVASKGRHALRQFELMFEVPDVDVVQSIYSAIAAPARSSARSSLCTKRTLAEPLPSASTPRSRDAGPRTIF